MIAGRLTMRAAIERNTAAGTDAWNNPVAPVFAPTGDPVACFIWSNQSRDVVDGRKSALVEDLRAMFALGADVAANDEIASVTDRKGNVIIAGRLRVLGPVQFKHTHVECALERLS